MNQKYKLPTEVHGVDFSGAKDAGKRIWITSASISKAGIRVDKVFPAEELPGGSSKLIDALGALREWIAGVNGIVGMDFPFGLPYQLVRGYGSWKMFLKDFPLRHASPVSFRRSCRSQSDGTELKRETDRLASTPFSPYNLRMYRQTYYGIREVLEPLVDSGKARVLPLQEPEAGKPWLLEICPASTLKRIGNYSPYKGPEERHRISRRAILNQIIASAPISLSSADRKLYESHAGGDALDSLLCCFTAFDLIRNRTPLMPDLSARQKLEAWVYV